MTALLASVTDLQEARMALKGGANIIDLKDPARGALGAVSNAIQQSVTQFVDRRRPVFIGTWLSSFGIISNFASFPESEALLLRTTDIHLDLKFERLFSPRIGLTIGYSYRGLRWSDDPPEDARDVGNAIKYPGRLPLNRSHHLIRTGINW